MLSDVIEITSLCFILTPRRIYDIEEEIREVLCVFCDGHIGVRALRNWWATSESSSGEQYVERRCPKLRGWGMLLMFIRPREPSNTASSPLYQCSLSPLRFQFQLVTMARLLLYASHRSTPMDTSKGRQNRLVFSLRFRDDAWHSMLELDILTILRRP